MNGANPPEGIKPGSYHWLYRDTGSPHWMVAIWNGEKWVVVCEKPYSIAPKQLIWWRYHGPANPPFKGRHDAD